MTADDRPATERVVDALAGSSVLMLGSGGAAWLAGSHTVAAGIWVTATVLGLLYCTTTLVTALRHHEISVDVIAVLALVGALAVNEPFAGAIITLMLATGALLETRANARARRDLSRLTQRTPTTVRRRNGADIEVVPLTVVVAGDHVVVAAGEIVPVDGRLVEPGSFDESALTGEPLPVEHAAGANVRSGVVNAGPAVEIVATATAADSTYAAIVRLVEQAQASSAHFVRFADRMAVVFVPLTVIVAAGAWAWGGSAVRAVAVLVVATPCPLLLAAPIAIMSGLSRAARRGVIVKGGGSLERLADGRTVLMDKTGTLTAGRPAVRGLVAAPGTDSARMLRLAAALEQVSPHVVADGIVLAARRRGLDLPVPTSVAEESGHGVIGVVDGHEVRVGKADWILPADRSERPEWAVQAGRRADLDDAMSVFIAVDGVPVGALLMDDPIRPDAPRLVRSLRRAGIDRVVMLTGDRREVAATVGRIVGVDDVQAECDPQAKLAAVLAESKNARTIMVGDGVNDAPALAAAGAGVAIAVGGGTASSEAADVVLTTGRLDALGEAISIARRSRRIGRQAAAVGMGLSFIAMGVAAAGRLPAAAGAALQEVIDAIAMGIALTVLLPARDRARPLTPADAATAAQLQEQHDAVLVVVDAIRDVADGLSTARPDLRPCRELLHRLDAELLPHERSDEALLLPIAARRPGGAEYTAALTRAHAEIEHAVVRMHRLIDILDDDAVSAADVVELRRLLYELHAVIRLHNALEDETASVLVP